MSLATPNINATIQVREMCPADAESWDAFVLANPQATFFHRAGWKTVIERAFGHTTFFFTGRRKWRHQGRVTYGAN